MPRPKFVAGNWKMYTTRQAAIDLATAVAKGLPGTATLGFRLTADGGGIEAVRRPQVESATRVAVCPPFPWLTAVADAVKGSPVAVGGQDCYFETEGAFTGEVSPAMLLDAGCRYVIVGHSERRHVLGETDELLNRKAKAALTAGLSVIFCVGEQLAEREADRTEAVLDVQLSTGLAGIPAGQMADLVIAYEPVWAIGTGKVATTDQAQQAHAFVRRKIASLFGENVASNLLIQYGGSVKPDNAAGLLHQPDVDGALVGGASLKADAFLAIVAAAG